MTQTPATPKPARFRRLVTAARLGPEALLQRDAGLQASERAALALRPLTANAPPQKVVFLIPLVGRHHVGNWPATCARLMATLSGLQRQSDGNWQAVICGQDRPDGLPEDPRITFLPFTTEVAGNDKWRKLAQLCDHLAELGPQAGYAMTFDADDLAHPELVAEMMARGAAGGYLAQTGYILDHRADTLALAAPRSLSQPLRKPFWKLCGSCAALRFDLANGQPEVDFLREMSQHEHRMFPYLARLAGRPLTALAAPRVLYLLNHGENFGARRGRVSFKTRFVQRFRVSDDSAIRKEFHLQ
ncbi:hypothetical protein [Marinovum sp.]|uniref:hypothetical protein n=1 Tax=Marinovum sp. TaxID=2024839 RepID=UPI002B273794|nr:hypothetical protein [Marinovum sp.]